MLAIAACAVKAQCDFAVAIAAETAMFERPVIEIPWVRYHAPDGGP